VRSTVPEDYSARGTVLSTYLPVILSRRLLDGPITEPESSVGPGAVMLTDIEGFTSHVEHLAALGPKGLDLLAGAVNAYFADLVALVYEHGGDVLHIAGDAFFCWWPAARDADLGDATRQACQAAKALQRSLHGRRLRDGRTFATRIGISAGHLQLSWVGGTAGRWELVPQGPPLDEVARAEAQSPAGGILVAAPAWDRVARSCRAIVRADGTAELIDVLTPVTSLAAAPRPADVPEERLRPFVPTPVYHWSPQVGTEWLAEIRPVTVVMTGVSDPATGSRSLAELQGAVAGFQTVIGHYGGDSKVVVDSKGITLAAVFGLPPRAQGNDAERALRASEALLQAYGADGVVANVGVATGRAFCGVFGSSLRREYTVHGDVVNVASRLAGERSGGVICDRPTAEATRGRLAFEDLQALSVKGRRGLVATHRPSWSSAAALPVVPPARLVGRQLEVDRLARRITLLATDGAGATVIIEGDAGLGKSRLLVEAVRMATDAGLDVLSVNADAIEHSTPYFAWRPLITELLGADEARPDQIGAADIVDELDLEPHLARLVPLLSGVTPLRIPDTELTAGMHGEVRAANTNLLLTALLERRTRGRRTLLAVEDVHWLDSMSWSLLLSIVRDVPGLLTVVTMRPLDLPPSEYHRLADLRKTEGIDLDGLDREGTRDLLASRLQVEHVPAALASFVHDRVAGHPFFCEELLSSLVEQGAVITHDGDVEVGDLNTLNVPSTVEGIVISRLDRLEPPVVLSAKVASVIGRSFRSSTVTAAHPLDHERQLVPARLAALASANLTVREGGEDDIFYLFRHEITREITYELITPAQRRPLHRAVAEWYETTYADDLATHFPVLAYHWSRAEEPDKAISYLEQSGEQALRNGAFEEARRFFSDALSTQGLSNLEITVLRRASWMMGLGTANYFLGKLTESRRLFEETVALLDRPIPIQRVKRSSAVLQQVMLQAAHRVTPDRFLGRRAPVKEALDKAVACYRALAQIYYLDGDAPDALVYVTAAGLNRGEEAGDSAELARIFIIAGGVAGIIGLTKLSELYCTQAIAMAEREDKFDAAAYVWHMRAIALAQPGRWRAAVDANDQALTLIKELGDFNLEAEAWQVRAAINFCDGDYAAASASWPETYRLGERNGNQQVRCWGLLDQAQVLLARGEVDAAGAALESALLVPTAPTDGTSAIEKLTVTAVTRLFQGRPAEAVEAADAAVEMVSRQPPTSFNWVDFCAQAVEVYLALLEEAEPYARAHRDELLARARRGTRQVNKAARRFWGSKPRVWLLRGMIRWREGDQPGARGAWDRAEAESRRLGLPFDLARAQLEVARHAPRGPARERRLAAASEVFEKRGALVLLARAGAAQGAGSRELWVRSDSGL
jgi:class 3 adenylate cyclase/tetratricopeptide (TPR) repeat protein